MEDTQKQAVGTISSGLLPDTLVLKAIDFVYMQLSAWRDDPSRPNEQTENKLNLQLCKFLNSRARNDFPMVLFEHEEYQVGHAVVDISALPAETTTIGAKIYAIYDPIIVLECKRLPAPSRDRETEYVTGGTENQGGGIQRFKLGLHGANHDIAAMIGYLQANTPNYWFNEINKWIIQLSNGTLKDVCVWNTTEMLEGFKEDPNQGIATCRSIHDRNGRVQSKISIFHLWVKMSN
ncbi:hypothetical protein [Dehalococcoides mccartyi]|uniref:hypothetical protein n=1 Tax=Dehalococcoides mccartyi TaxID=61435 RepID=UPI001AF59584|nr:hypothetical protein [Dehalococcoides mccartyi]BCT55298.1 hypothetical protein DHCNIT_000610 [Dehalococcoides mccartyi]